ncbi:adenylate kinase [Candidatus Saganbacteria bacterium]|uniref:Adenylate kinase n=1 Tax=Candidatus Saganbacteria bacterium TaxID=2575572 RepID=A0A9D6UK43_UNCSA|nr:adenylate kinase [Candidatus Saganbacteria bacterium]
MILVFMGPPGSGKGTQAKLLAQALRIPHISLGDILREEVELKTETGLRAKEFMHAGRLVPDELTIALTRRRILRDDCKPGFIVDGFPRSSIQAEAFDRMLEEERLTLSRVVYFKISQEQAVERLLGRAALEGRTDDNKDAIRTRFEVYEKETRPLIERYAKKGKLLSLDASLSIAEVFKKLKASCC